MIMCAQKFFRQRRLARLMKLRTALELRAKEVSAWRATSWRRGDASGFIESSIKLSMLLRQVSLVESRINDIKFSEIISNCYEGA